MQISIFQDFVFHDFNSLWWTIKPGFKAKDRIADARKSPRADSRTSNHRQLSLKSCYDLLATTHPWRPNVLEKCWELFLLLILFFRLWQTWISTRPPQTESLRDRADADWAGLVLVGASGPPAAGGRRFDFVVRPRGGLSKFDKQIQEKHIHEKPNLYNLLTEHSVWL